MSKWKRPKWVYRFCIEVREQDDEPRYNTEDILMDKVNEIEEMYSFYDWLYEDDAEWEIMSWEIVPIWSWREMGVTLRFRGH
jgi:hypothetical protein